jgi:hypothetical protein
MIGGIGASVTAFAAKHPPKRAGGEDPFVQCDAADTQGIIEILIGPRSVAVERDGEAVHTESGREWVCAHAFSF